MFVLVFCGLSLRFFGGIRPSNRSVAITFSFIVGEFAQRVSGIAYLMPGSKDEV